MMVIIIQKKKIYHTTTARSNNYYYFFFIICLFAFVRGWNKLWDGWWRRMKDGVIKNHFCSNNRRKRRAKKKRIIGKEGVGVIYPLFCMYSEERCVSPPALPNTESIGQSLATTEVCPDGPTSSMHAHGAVRAGEGTQEGNYPSRNAADYRLSEKPIILTSFSKRGERVGGGRKGCRRTCVKRL